MDAYLKCKVGQGQFSEELAIVGRTHDGATFSLFAPESEVLLDAGRPMAESDVDGLLRVDVVESNDSLALVRLPGQTFGNGRIVTVSARDIERRRLPESV